MRLQNSLNPLLALLTFFAVAAPLLALGQARSLEMDREKSRVTFESAAKLETINGVSDEVRGSVRLDPQDLSTARATVTVPVASIRTGIALRDEHLRGEKWLNGEAHPEIRFELTRVEGPAQLSRGESVSAKLHGRFTVNGVTKDVVVPAKIGLSGEALDVRARFKIKLSDHGIEIPAVVKLKVADEVTVRIQLRAA